MSGNEGRDACHRIQIGGHDIRIGHDETELVFDESDQFENAGGVDDFVFDQRCVVLQVVGGVAKQEVLDDEGLDAVFDGLGS